MVNFINGENCVVCVNCEVRAPTTRRLEGHSIDAAAAPDHETMERHEHDEHSGAEY